MGDKDKDTWGEYGKLVLNELERLNDNHEKMREDIEIRFAELNQKLTEVKNVEKSVVSQSTWVEKVNDVWSPSQMKEAKDEIYKQKSRWVAAIAIITFVQVLVGIGFALWSHLK